MQRAYEPFRAQASRALGANIWRQSHNPYAPGLYGVLDALGTMCWDENRDYGARYMGGAYAAAMRDMVKRDRNHPVRAPTRSHGLSLARVLTDTLASGSLRCLCVHPCIPCIRASVRHIRASHPCIAPVHHIRASHPCVSGGRA